MVRILSGDRPGSRILAVLFALLLAVLALAPFLFEGSRALDTAARICVFAVLAASYDLILGYAGIVSFAHTMFFGIGAYGVALASLHVGRSFTALGAGTLAGMAVAALLAALIGLFSLRVRAIFFAMITLAVASAFAVLVSQLPALTGGEDGLTYRIPRALTAAETWGRLPQIEISLPRLLASRGAGGAEVLSLGGMRISGKIISYYLVLGGSLVLVLAMLRIVNAPFGRVLQAIRENDLRAEAVGYSVVRYRVAATIISAAFAALAGALYAVWLRYVGPDTTLSFDIMIDILLMVVIGGMGTIWGPVAGAVFLVLAQTYLQDILAGASDLGIPVLDRLFDPDRWLLWLGLAFILCVRFFPSGLVGRLRHGPGGPA
ncbi:MAG: branched-chain amino acid ABC transporter permease [Rhodobacteraceae bacterium]|nr:branched-chain amino acid ABC transporter permease [Paracoccaceae bacterium]